MNIIIVQFIHILYCHEISRYESENPIKNINTN